MEVKIHCAVHGKQPAEYVCPTCKDLPLCAACKQEHEKGMGHSSDSCKEVGLALMHKLIQEAGVQQTRELAGALTESMKKLGTELSKEIEKLQSNCALHEEEAKMKKLEQEGGYAELYFYAKSLPLGDAKNEAAIEEISKCLMKTLDTACLELQKARNGLAAMIKAAVPQHKPMLAAYKKDEVLALGYKFVITEEEAISALKSPDISKMKAIYIESWDEIGDRTALELASCLKANPVSAFFLSGSEISDVGAEALAKAAFFNRSLSTLCLWGEQISDTGAKVMAEAARNCPSLTMFSLYGSISDSGAKAVAEALKGSPLSAFSLLSPGISDTGAIAVAEMISSCSRTLSALYLVSRNISVAGVKKAVDAVRSCSLLSVFYLGGCMLSGEMVTYVLETVTMLSSLRSVNLGIGEVSKEQMEYCLTRLQQGGIGKQLKLRFWCDDDRAKSVCEKCIAEWNGKFAEFTTVNDFFLEDRSLIRRYMLNPSDCSLLDLMHAA